jgi:hypothetical protein
MQLEADAGRSSASRLDPSKDPDLILGSIDPSATPIVPPREGSLPNGRDEVSGRI